MNEESRREIAKVAAEAALEYLKKEKERQKKARRDRRLRNTKLLLRNYRKFKLHVADSFEEIEELQNPNSLEYLNEDDLAIESILNNKKRTAAMIIYIDRMLEVYRFLSEKTVKTEERRWYNVLHAMYVAEDEKSVQEIAIGQNIDPRTVYKDLNKACEALSSLIFGIDGIKINEA